MQLLSLLSLCFHLLQVTSAGVTTAMGTCFDASNLAILFSVHSVNHRWFSGSTANCMAFAIPHTVASGGQSAQALFCEGIQYSTSASSSGSKRPILLPVCSLNHNEPSPPLSIQYGSVYAFGGVLPP